MAGCVCYGLGLLHSVNFGISGKLNACIDCLLLVFISACFYGGLIWHICQYILEIRYYQLGICGLECGELVRYEGLSCCGLRFWVGCCERIRGRYSCVLCCFIPSYDYFTYQTSNFETVYQAYLYLTHQLPYASSISALISQHLSSYPALKVLTSTSSKNWLIFSQS